MDKGSGITSQWLEHSGEENQVSLRFQKCLKKGKMHRTVDFRGSALLLSVIVSIIVVGLCV